MEWIEIKRDKNGLVTKECRSEMLRHELVVVRFYSRILRRIAYNVLEKRDMEEMMIFENYDNYLPIPKVEL